MIKGVFCGLAACALWGLTYLLPVLLPDYGSGYISLSRAMVMGLVSLILFIWGRNRFSSLAFADWKYATRISIIGNLVQAYFLMLSAEYAGVPIAGICFGGVPVLVALFSNEREKRRGNRFVPINQLAFPLIAIVIGFILINFTELQSSLLTQSRSAVEFFFGLGCGLISTVMWTWYPIRNADWLIAHPQIDPLIWTTAQCLILLPLSVFLYVVVYIFDDGMFSVLGPNPLLYIFLMIIAGVFCSWIATALWNFCSATLPTALVGQLLVFETIFAVTYGHIQRMEWPSPTMFLGMLLLIAGICLALKTFDHLYDSKDKV